MKDTTIIVLAIIAVVILFGGSVLTAGTQIIDDISDRIWHFVKYGFEDRATNATGFASIGLKVTYKDGTTKEFKPDEMSILPLTISDDQGEIQTIEAVIYVKVEHTAENIASYTVSGYYWAIDYDPTLTPDYIWFQQNTSWTVTGTGWISGETKTVKSFIHQASDIEQKLREGNRDYGIWSITMVTQVTVELTDDTGFTASKSGQTFAKQLFVWEESFKLTSLQISLTPAILRP